MVNDARPGGLKEHSSLRARLVRALASCGTEADIVQVLWAELRPRFGYDIILLKVLEREGWFHAITMDRGLLQDVQRRELARSNFAPFYRRGRVVVSHATSEIALEQSRGPGSSLRPQTFIWVPIRHQGRIIGSAVYQLYERREIPPEEVALLKAVHARMGPVVSNAWLNEITRNQAVRLSALNAIARALSSTRDEMGIVAALRGALGPLLPIDALELAVADPAGADRVRVLRMSDSRPRQTELRAGSRRLRDTRQVLRTGRSLLRAEEDREDGSAMLVPVAEGERRSGVLAVRSARPGAYEQSTLAFLEQVADQVALALRNATSYAAIEAQRRRLEVVNAVGRRLAGSLDRWSIMRTVREELSHHLRFDVFCLAAVEDRAGELVVEGYVYDSGREQPLAAVPLAAAGPTREAYETGRPVLIRRSPWARALESGRRSGESRVFGTRVVLDVTRPDARGRIAARSLLWVPVLQGDQVTALLSLQSYQAGSFDQWHVDVLQDVAAHVSLTLGRLQLVAALDRQARLMNTILSHSPVGVLLEDTRGCILYANPTVERLYGVAAERLVGERAEQLLERAGARRERAAGPDPAPAGPDRETFELRLGEKIVRVRQVTIPGSGDLTLGKLTLHEDITEERALLDAKDLMLRAIGHEVRSPAAAMRSTIAGLVQWGDVMDAEQRGALVTEAYSQSERLLSLVENQLIIAKLEAGRFEPSPAPVALAWALDHVRGVLRSRYGPRVDVVRARLPAGLPEAACEPTHLEQVLTNLIGNALEHTWATRIQVAARARGGRLEVSVADNGRGLGPELVDTLFAGTAPAGQHRARGGLGLGLYLCRLVVERSFGGRIWIERTGPHGTAFRFTIPMAETAAGEPSAAPTRAGVGELGASETQ